MKIKNLFPGCIFFFHEETIYHFFSPALWQCSLQHLFAVDVSPAQRETLFNVFIWFSMVQVHMPKHSWLPASFPKDLSQKRK